jgi:hypothetical protein
VYTSEEPLCVKAQQGESLNLCHGSKGLWLKVSSMLLVQHKYYALSQVESDDAQDERSKQSWIRDEVETEALNALLSTV